MVWSIFWLWFGAWAVSINWCPEVEYSYQCDISWITFTTFLTCVGLWIAGLLGLMFYHDNIRDNSDY
jgi:hypothetical protein